MSRPIPVIAFAIAAYAIYGRRMAPPAEKMAPPAEDASSQQVFWRLWRNLPQGGGEAMVRIGVATPQTEAAPVAIEVCEAGEDLWLRSVVETPEGFSGMVAIAPGPMRATVGASRVAFQLRHIRGWRLRPAGRSLAPMAAGLEAGADR